jgi:hypothetical protein
MAVKSQTIDGTRIINEIDSSNISKTEYDTSTKKMITEFKNGSRYEYENVPHTVYAEFRLAESQGKYFTTKISKVYKYNKLP